MENDILDSLNDLCYDGPLDDEAAFAKALEGGHKSLEYTKLVHILAEELKKLCNLEETVNIMNDPDESSSFLLELSSFLKELGCPYKKLTTGHMSSRLQTKEDRLLLLDYMISELMAARMVNVDCASGKPSAMEIVVHESPTAKDLKEILIALKFNKPPPNITAEMLFSKLEAKLKDSIQKEGGELVGKPLYNKALSEKEWRQLEAAYTDMFEEYALRRETLLTRLECTIQSFEWSERLRSKKDVIQSMYRGRRAPLRGKPSVALSHFLGARSALLAVEKTSSARVRANTHSEVNRVIIGRVPDRGGRPNEQQPPPPEMPSWQQRSAPQMANERPYCPTKSEIPRTSTAALHAPGIPIAHPSLSPAASINAPKPSINTSTSNSGASSDTPNSSLPPNSSLDASLVAQNPSIFAPNISYDNKLSKAASSNAPMSPMAATSNAPDLSVDMSTPVGLSLSSIASLPEASIQSPKPTVSLDTIHSAKTINSTTKTKTPLPKTENITIKKLPDFILKPQGVALPQRQKTEKLLVQVKTETHDNSSEEIQAKPFEEFKTNDDKAPDAVAAEEMKKQLEIALSDQTLTKAKKRRIRSKIKKVVLAQSTSQASTENPKHVETKIETPVANFKVTDEQLPKSTWQQLNKKKKRKLKYLAEHEASMSLQGGETLQELSKRKTKRLKRIKLMKETLEKNGPPEPVKGAQRSVINSSIRDKTYKFLQCVPKTWRNKLLTKSTVSHNPNKILTGEAKHRVKVGKIVQELLAEGKMTGIDWIDIAISDSNPSISEIPSSREELNEKNIELNAAQVSNPSTCQIKRSDMGVKIDENRPQLVSEYVDQSCGPDSANPEDPTSSSEVNTQNTIGKKKRGTRAGKLVKERNAMKEQMPGPHKRPFANESPQKSKIKRPKHDLSIPSTDQFEPKDDYLRVAIMIEPFEDLSAELASALEQSIEEYMDKDFDENASKPNHRFPAFRHRPLFSEGVLKMWCEDDFTLQWLHQAISHLSPRTESWLVVKRQTEIPRPVEASMLIPYHKGEDFGVVLKALKSQNPWYDMARWSIDFSIRQNENGLFVKLKIPPCDAKQLLEKNQRMYYKLGSSFVSFDKPQPIASVTPKFMHGQNKTATFVTYPEKPLQQSPFAKESIMPNKFQSKQQSTGIGTASVGYAFERSLPFTSDKRNLHLAKQSSYDSSTIPHSRQLLPEGSGRPNFGQTQPFDGGTLKPHGGSDSTNFSQTRTSEDTNMPHTYVGSCKPNFGQTQTSSGRNQPQTSQESLPRRPSVGISQQSVAVESSRPLLVRSKPAHNPQPISGNHPSVFNSPQLAGKSAQSNPGQTQQPAGSNTPAPRTQHLLPSGSSQREEPMTYQMLQRGGGRGGGFGERGGGFGDRGGRGGGGFGERGGRGGRVQGGYSNSDPHRPQSTPASFNQNRNHQTYEVPPGGYNHNQHQGSGYQGGHDSSGAFNQGGYNKPYQGQGYQNQGYQSQGHQNQGYQSQGYQSRGGGYQNEHDDRDRRGRGSYSRGGRR